MKQRLWPAAFALLLSVALAPASCAGSDEGSAPDVDPGSGPDADAGSDPGSDPPPDSESAPETDSAAGPDADPGSEPDTAPDADPDTGPTLTPSGTLAAALSCAPSADACVELPVDATIRASYRKDYYLPKAIYPEYTEVPEHGGRFQIAGIAAVSGAVSDVLIDGVSVTERLQPPEPSIEWHHVWPDPVVEGEPLWVAFHSREAAWDAAESGAVTVMTEAGAALEGEFPVRQTPLPLTYVTASEDGASLLIHVRNDDTLTHRATALRVDGRDVLAGGVACVPDAELLPGEQALWTVPLCEAAQPGQAWTVSVSWEAAPDSVGAGRLLRPHFPIEAWGSSGDCAAPGAHAENYQAHLDAGFDTLYLYWGASDKCDYKTKTLVNEQLPPDPEVYVLIGDDFPYDAEEQVITDTTAVAGFLTGDESDGAIYKEDGTPAPANKASKARKLWARYPEVTVYNGAMTHGNVGTFAGMTDVQGIDVYIGACAPHITTFGVFRPLSSPHDFLRNTRNNHMPLPTWLYAQGLHSGWNVGGGEGIPEVHFQPSPQEVLLQALMVMTAGGKGLMWFQTTQSEAEAVPESWDAISQSNWLFRGVRHLLREGDPTGAVLASSGEQVLAEAIRAQDAIVVPVINLATVQTVDDQACIEWLIADLPQPHWILDAQTPEIRVPIPAAMPLVEVFELTLQGEVVDAEWAVDEDAREAVLPAVELSHELPVRLFVIAAQESVRAQVASELP